MSAFNDYSTIEVATNAAVPLVGSDVETRGRDKGRRKEGRTDGRTDGRADGQTHINQVISHHAK